MTSVAFKGLSNILTWSPNDVFTPQDMIEEWQEIEKLHQKKLWHQLTLKILEFVKHPQMQENENLIKLYNNFISLIEMKINPMSLVELAGVIVKQYKDPHKALEFLIKIEEKVKKHPMAVAYCQVLRGKIALDKLDDRPQTKLLMNQVNEFIDGSDEISIIDQQYYLLASQLHEREGCYEEYYRTTLRFLACIDNLENDIPLQDRQEYAYRLIISALLADNVYNLGELLEHPILYSLEGTSYYWLVNLLHMFYNGEVKGLEKMRRHWGFVPEMKRNSYIMEEKIRLLCIMEMAFVESSKGQRRISFEKISTAAFIPKEEVEFFLMKAFAKDLIRGSIDQVSQTVEISWVLPRVLDHPQIYEMILRLDQWCQDVKSCGILIENQASDIITQ